MTVIGANASSGGHQTGAPPSEQYSSRAPAVRDSYTRGLTRPASMVRCRLSAGGDRIRTLSPSTGNWLNPGYRPGCRPSVPPTDITGVGALLRGLWPPTVRVLSIGFYPQVPEAKVQRTAPGPPHSTHRSGQIRIDGSRYIASARPYKLIGLGRGPANRMATQP